MPDLHYATSPDGTRIAYETTGRAGRPRAAHRGAFSDRSTMTVLADLLAPDHPVVTRDRRSRGGSETGPALHDGDTVAAAESNGQGSDHPRHRLRNGIAP